MHTFLAEANGDVEVARNQADNGACVTRNMISTMALGSGNAVVYHLRRELFTLLASLGAWGIEVREGPATAVRERALREVGC